MPAAPGHQPLPDAAPAGLSRYGQLAEALRQRLLAGQWQPGEGLPAEAALARAHGVALGTMRQALAVLVQEGWLVRVQGKGTFVREGIEGASMLRFFRFRDGPGDAAQAGDGRDAWPVPDSRILQRRTRAASAAEAQALGLASGAPLLAIKRLRSLRARPCLLEAIALPLPRFAALAAAPVAGWGPLLYPAYQRLCGVLVAQAQDELGVERLNARQAHWLQLPVQAPAVCVTRRAFDRAGQCVELRRTWGDAFAFSYTAQLR